MFALFDAFDGIDFAKAKFDVTALDTGNSLQHRTFASANVPPTRLQIMPMGAHE
jgi:hypothetical protein